MSAKVDLCTISKLMVLMPAAIEVRLPQSLCRSLDTYCTMRIRRSKRIVAGSLACENRMSRGTTKVYPKPLSAKEHAKAERIFSND